VTNVAVQYMCGRITNLVIMADKAQTANCTLCKHYTNTNLDDRLVMLVMLKGQKVDYKIE